MQAYRFREPYSAEALGILARIAGSRKPRVLDLGCGCGDLTLGLSEFATSVDAVDISTEMLSEARKRPRQRSNYLVRVPR